MSRAPLSAVEWAKALPRGGRVPWDELEAHVLREHPDLLALLGPAGAQVRRPSRWVIVLLAPVIVIVGLIGLAVVWAPIWGLTTLLGDQFGIEDVDGRSAIPIAGIALLISMGVQIVLLIRLAIGRRSTEGIGGGTAILAVLMLIAIVLIGTRQDVPGWEGWAAAAAATGFLGAFVEVGERRPSRRPPRGPIVPEEEPPAERLARDARIDAAVRALPDDERERLLDDRRRALEWLRMVGTISPDEAARAHRAPLGRLAASV
jgi:hypothetical protein